MQKGTVKFFNATKGFGFITPGKKGPQARTRSLVLAGSDATTHQSVLDTLMIALATRHTFPAQAEPPPSSGLYGRRGP